MENMISKWLWSNCKFSNYLNIGLWQKCEWKFKDGIFPQLQNIIRLQRINLPSPRSQWRKYEWEKVKIDANGGVVRADLFYGDCLFLPCRFRSFLHSIVIIGSSCLIFILMACIIANIRYKDEIDYSRRSSEDITRSSKRFLPHQRVEFFNFIFHGQFTMNQASYPERPCWWIFRAAKWVDSVLNQQLDHLLAKWNTVHHF